MDWKIEVVVVPVSDVDRAKRFYEVGCGFVVDLDHQATETMRVAQLPRVILDDIASAYRYLSSLAT
jgi:catechol 2,3-dioxygenase-like lactoylglutathione lyase family enzyme